MATMIRVNQIWKHPIYQEQLQALQMLEAGAQIAEQILRELSFDPSEIQEITSAIREHRNAARSDTLSSLIYDADKASRNCFSCPAEKECYWSAEKKNLTITY